MKKPILKKENLSKKVERLKTSILFVISGLCLSLAALYAKGIGFDASFTWLGMAGMLLMGASLGVLKL
jgi:hypothetical protein|tara:strand:+ start:10764 stop:10967 length:204 start_codon:yes stop_codon:yes gene_type:complete